MALGLSPMTGWAAPGAAGAARDDSTAVGTGGAAASVDRLATQTAIRVLRDGGNAIDAAVAAAAVLGVTEPFSCGIGGGGFMVIRLVDGNRVVTIDGREKAPAAFRPNSFIDPETGDPIPFGEAVTSGLGVGVPGTLKTWSEALKRYGTRSLADSLRPARRIARHGFEVDQTFRDSIFGELRRFRAFTSTRQTFLRNGDPPAVGSIIKNPDLARALRRISRRGIAAFYRGSIGRAIARTVQNPPTTGGTKLQIRPGLMTRADLRNYDALLRRPTRVSYRGYDVFGMGPPSSGGSTVGEALNILEGFDLARLSRTRFTHKVIESERISFADRDAYLGDPAYSDVPLEGLLSQGYADVRRKRINFRPPDGPIAEGNPFPFDDGEGTRPAGSVKLAREGRSTTHLTVSDRLGNVVAYTFTIEQIGGSGIVVPNHGFLLNNELTDFSFEPPGPNAPASGKRPRSSMSPTIVMRNGRPFLALGSPGGATIITTVLETLVNHLDRGMTLPEAIAAPRFTQLNLRLTYAEPAFINSPVADRLRERGHAFAELSEIGTVAAVKFLGGGRVLAAAEPVRRGSGSAAVENPG
jgi:gamma-glutamyltranspeptidase / glutathione hydrolase